MTSPAPSASGSETVKPRFGELLVSSLRSLARRFLLGTIVVIGAICGVVAVLFHKYTELARELLIGFALGRHGVIGKLLVVIVPAVVFSLLAALIRRVAPRSIGANLARVRMAYSSDPSLLGVRSVLTTFLATPLSLGAGAPLGPEGPIVVVASGVSAAIARMLKLPRRVVRGMIPVGAAAGIAAIFNTPITGVVFALEEVIGTAERGLLGGVIVGAVAAAVVERSLLGGKPLLAAPFASWSDARELLGFALVGLASGVISGYAIGITHRLKRRWARLMPSMVARAATAGLMIGCLGLLAPSILGVGYDSVSFWLHGGGTASAIALDFAVKTLAFVIAISAGILGGTFAPSLFMGAALGAAIGQTAHLLFPHAEIDPRAYALLGMGSLFAGLLRSPIAAVLIVIELTRDYDLIVPLMLAVSLSVAVSRRISHLSIVEQQMLDEGFVETHDTSDPLAGVHVSALMTSAVTAVLDEASLLDAARAVGGSRHHVYPVVDNTGRLVGVISRETIDDAARNASLERAVREVMTEPQLIARADDLALELVARMRSLGMQRCPVIADDQSRTLVGFLSPSDIFRARMRHPSSEQEEAFEIFE